MEKNAQLGIEVQKVAKAKDCTPAQVALAWGVFISIHSLISNGDPMALQKIDADFFAVRSHSGKGGFGTMIPIPGSSTEGRAIENNKEVTLTEAELKELEEIMNKTEVAGARYPH